MSKQQDITFQYTQIQLMTRSHDIHLTTTHGMTNHIYNVSICKTRRSNMINAQAVTGGSCNANHYLVVAEVTGVTNVSK